MTPDEQRALAAELFNGTWALLDTGNRSTDDDDRMVHMAHASRHHWGAVGGPEHLARGEWLCSHVYAALGRAEPAAHHAARCLELCRRHGLVDWDLAFAHEAVARAALVAGDRAGAAAAVEAARAVEVTDAESAALLAADLATIDV